MIETERELKIERIRHKNRLIRSRNEREKEWKLLRRVFGFDKMSTLMSPRIVDFPSTDEEITSSIDGTYVLPIIIIIFFIC